MIEQLDITNFQGHKQLSLDLNHPIVCIIGKSDSGKSAILRALKWALLNESPGGDWHHNGASKAVVAAQVDRSPVKRATDGATNSYTLGEAVFKAFGREVPEQVAKFLRVTSLNFQGQHDPPFWFSESPAEVSRQLNSIVNLELIDVCNSRIDSALRTERTVLAERREREAAAKEQRRGYRYVAEMAREFEFLQALAETATKLEQKAVALGACIEKIESSQAIIDTYAEAEEEIRWPLRLGKKAVESEKRASTLGKLITEAEQLERLANITVPDTTELKTLAARSVQLSKQAQQLGALIKVANDLEAEIKTNEALLKAKEQEIKELTGGKCPACGKPMKL